MVFSITCYVDIADPVILLTIFNCHTNAWDRTWE